MATVADSPQTAIDENDSGLTAMPVREGPFRSAVFAGGGCRCFWQVGFWEVAAPALALQPRAIGAVSAGAAMACMVFAGVVSGGIQRFKEHARANRRNAYPLNLLRKRAVFPHAAIYRRTIVETLDQAAFERLRAGPDVRVLLARLPPWLGPRAGVLAAFAAYQAERAMNGRVHPSFARRMGFVAEVVSVRRCRKVDEVADLVLQSSCTPPFTPVYQRGGRAVLDGGLIDNVPVEAVDPAHRPTLVLLTRRYAAALLPHIDGRTYVQPSEPVPIEKWDYTNPDGVQRTYDLGRRDGERFARSLAARGGAPPAITSTTRHEMNHG